MARLTPTRDLNPILNAASTWITTCLIEDCSIFGVALWTGPLIDEVYSAFSEHPDYGEESFQVKLKGQLAPASSGAKQLMAEMLWALLLFPSNVKATTKRRQVLDVWQQSGQPLVEDHPLLSNEVLAGIGSGGLAFNTLRPLELEFMVEIARSLKRMGKTERRDVLTNYDHFFSWIDSVPQRGQRQFRHMLRYFAFPDRVERMSSNNDRRKVLAAFSVAPMHETASWTDRQLDEALLALREAKIKAYPGIDLDFYEPPLQEAWKAEHQIATLDGEVTVTIPDKEDEEPNEGEGTTQVGKSEARLSHKVQAKLAEIGAIMGFRIWLPKADRARVLELMLKPLQATLLGEKLPLNYNAATIATVEQIDVLWITKGGSIARAFEVEHTTAVYSGLLRMADLLSLQPNMNIQLYIVAPEERREKVFDEMRRPVFSRLERGPLYDTCAFLSYESVDGIRALGHLSHTNASILSEYEERTATE